MRQAKTENCPGEAHSNAYIDNCMICLNHGWGKLFYCPDDNLPLKNGKCPKCKEKFSTER